MAVLTTLLVVGLMLLAAGALYQVIGARRSARRYPAPGAFVDVGGHRLHFVCDGAGEPAVLFDSGIAASSLSWVRVMRGVATFSRACAYDRTGLGWSEMSRGRRSVGRMIAELRAVIGHVAGGGPVVLVGHSFGAFLVCAYASQYPRDVAGLVLVEPPSDWHEMTPRQAFMLRGGVHLSRVGAGLARVGVVRACLALLTGGAPGVPRNFVRVFGSTAARTLERLVGEVRKLPEEVHPVVSMLWSQPKCFRAMGQHIAAMQEMAHLVSGVATLPDVPLVVISSGDQPAETLAKQRRLTTLSPQGRHLIASRSAHWVQFDEPDLVVAAVRDVVERARSRHG
jgi:pimeloyl-ACP methyl ester carboxylesterase